MSEKNNTNIGIYTHTRNIIFVPRYHLYFIRYYYFMYTVHFLHILGYVRTKLLPSSAGL